MLDGRFFSSLALFADMRNYLILADNGAADALGRALAKSRNVGRIDCAGFNVGLARLGRCFGIDTDDFDAVAELAAYTKADVVVPLSSIQLAKGIADFLTHKGFKCFGAGRQGAALEASKQFAKTLANEARIPIPRSEWHLDTEGALGALERFDMPIVVKSSGHAKPQGVEICADRETARSAVARITQYRNDGMEDHGVLIEEYIDGEELSLMGILDGVTFQLLGLARDHKRLRDGNLGPNTGGMGAFSPVPGMALETGDLVETFVHPLSDALVRRGIDYSGILYLGLIRSAAGWKLLEVNVRPGDPETQVVLPGVQEDIEELMWAAANRSLASTQGTFGNRTYLSVACATLDYPQGPSMPAVDIQGIRSLEQNGDLDVIYARCSLDGSRLRSRYGRVAHVVGSGESIDEARASVYSALDRVELPGLQFRTDVGKRP